MVWRWLMIGGAAVLIVGTAESWVWASALVVPMLVGAGAVHYIPQPTFKRWIADGRAVLADGLLVSLALLGAATLPPLLFVAFFLIVIVCTVVIDRRRALLASAAVIGLVSVLATSGILPGQQLTLAALFALPFLVAAAFHFCQLAEELSGDRQAVERAQQETSELWVLLEITDTIGSTLDVGQVLRSIAHRVGELIDTDSCSILLADQNKHNCFVLASKGHPEIDRFELDLDKYPEIRHALETRAPVIIDDVESDPLIESARKLIVERGYRSMMVLPLLFGDEVLGALCLKSKRETPFTAAEQRFCKVAAGASANALKNALLFREVKEAAERHRGTSETLRRVLDCTPDMIVATGSANEVTEFNRGAERLTGWNAEKAAGKPLDEILDADLEAVCGDEPQEIVLRRANGIKSEISVVSAPLSGPDGEAQGRVWIGRDVTKLRRAESSLIKAERLSSLGEVVAGVAHELNNPLSGVMGYAELLRTNVVDPDQVRDLDRIVESAMRCQKIVYNLLSFSRKHRPEKKYQDLNDCVRKVLELKSYHLRSSQVDIVLELDPNLPLTCYDFHQIEQVILNLLNNAEQAISSIRRPGRVVLRTGVRDKMLFLEVEDNGPGVPIAVRERVFDPFFTTKDVGQGTGLGLSVSYGIVEEHGGRIELTTEPAEGGARFRVWLPVVEGEVDEAEALVGAAEVEDRPLSGVRILVAEDEPLVLELFWRVLRQEGAEVTLAQDGQEAWERLEQEDFDLIVADLRMPNLDGQQLYERVAEERPDMLRRFVFSTGDLVRPETVSFLSGLPNRILQKPLELETVRRVLSQVAAAR